MLVLGGSISFHNAPQMLDPRGGDRRGIGVLGPLAVGSSGRDAGVGAMLLIPLELKGVDRCVLGLAGADRTVQLTRAEHRASMTFTVVCC